MSHKPINVKLTTPTPATRATAGDWILCGVGLAFIALLIYLVGALL